jgi:hypothetical protein
MREGDNLSNLVDMIKDQQSKKRRGKYNKNEKLFEFIESTHMIQRYNQNTQIAKNLQIYF